MDEIRVMDVKRTSGTKLHITLTRQDNVEIPENIFGNREFPGDEVSLLEVTAVVPNAWMAADLLRYLSDTLGTHLEAEDARRKEDLAQG